MMLQKSLAAGISSRSAVQKRGVRAVTRAADNVKDAQAWIGTWKEKKAAGASRPLWWPGSEPAAHLDGSLPGDHGFDPLNLGQDAAKLKWYQQAELQHCRWAMLGVAGVLGPELASSIGISWPGAGVPWFEAGKFEYFAPASSLFIVQMFLFAWVEIRRLQDIKAPGSASQDPIFSSNKLPAGEVGYPGGIFDPFGWSKGDMAKLKLNEIKNGRLAMVAYLGFVVQAGLYGTTPLQALGQHLADPWATTVWSNKWHIPL